MSANEFFSDYNHNSAVVIQNKIPQDLINADLHEFISKMAAIKDLKDMEPFLQSCSHIKEVFELVRALALCMIDHMRWYKFVDYSSIYEFCQKRQGVFHLSSSSSINADINCAKALCELCDRFSSAIPYLEKHGEETGRGFKDSNGNWRGFKVADFMGCKTKLALFYRYITKYREADIDFEVFFSSTDKEYKDYLKSHPNYRFPIVLSRYPTNNIKNDPNLSVPVPVFTPNTSDSTTTSTASTPAIIQQQSTDGGNNISESLEDIDPYASTEPFFYNYETHTIELKPAETTPAVSEPQALDDSGKNSEKLISTEPIKQNSNEITIVSEPQQPSEQISLSHLPHGILYNYYLFRLLPPSVDYESFTNNMLQISEYIKRYSKSSSV
jgi:hypothetical protein